jgi:heme/copper-type cytochrome/quinol oxidase subunit 2
METLIGVVVFGLLAYFSWRRRRRMSPEQRAIDDLRRETIRLRREVRRHRYD